MVAAIEREGRRVGGSEGEDEDEDEDEEKQKNEDGMTESGVV